MAVSVEMIVKFAALALVFTAITAPADAEPIERTEIHVVDGDTVEAHGSRWRLLGFDTPEIYRAKCGSERDQGIVVAARLVELLRRHGGTLIDQSPASLFNRGGFGRRAGSIRLNDGRLWRDIAVSEGLAVVWKPGATKKSWC